MKKNKVYTINLYYTDSDKSESESNAGSGGGASSSLLSSKTGALGSDLGTGGGDASLLSSSSSSRADDGTNIDCTRLALTLCVSSASSGLVLGSTVIERRASFLSCCG